VIEICVSDNNSTDFTEEVLKKWQKKLPIIHSKNEENVGYDRNVITVGWLASGTYIWYLGDDDALAKGTLKKVTEDLKRFGSPDMKAVYINALLKNRWITKCPFEEFRRIEKEKLNVKPNVSFGGSICIRKDGLEKITEGIEIKSGMLFKKEYGDFVLNDFVHSYLFMESLKSSRYIGIAPNYGIVVIADGNRQISYKKKLYLELIITKYVLEVKKYYPWFNEAETIVDSKTRVIGRTFINSSLVSQRPDLTELFNAFQNVLLKILDIENRKFEIVVLKSFEAFRKVPGAKMVVFSLFRIVKFVYKMPFENKNEDDPILNKNIEYALTSVNRLLQIDLNPNSIRPKANNELTAGNSSD